MGSKVTLDRRPPPSSLAVGATRSVSQPDSERWRRRSLGATATTLLSVRRGPIVSPPRPTIRPMALERPLESLSDDEVLSSLADLLRQSRRLEAPLVAHIGEVHARHLYARYAVSSMFSYCTNVLHLSEGETQLRITVAQAARDHPVLLEMLADGRMHLSGVARLAPVLTTANRDA